jgi:dTDP-glucose 4,6-dehydratase/UDP-glucose 4-epimerase
VKKILIIGSKGFIGSHCLAYYRQQGAEVFGCDVMIDYTDPLYFLIDATNADYRDIFENNAIDVCINCSGAASVADSMRNPRRDFELNTHNVFKMLDAIRLFRPECKFIQLSSAAVYGNPAVLPIIENSQVNPISPYGWHKLYSENICHEFATVYKSKIAILRPFSVFGKGLKKQLFWDVFHKLKAEKPFELFGTGHETRDFIHITDLVLMIDLLINKCDFKCNIYNAANGESVKIKEIINEFALLSGFNTPYSFSNQVKAGDPLFWQSDISKMRALGYKRTVTSQQGLNEYIQWAKENG